MSRPARRWFFFFLMVILGIGAGLLVGWEVCPLALHAPEPDTLSLAYQTDIVLMTAELYQNDGDLIMAQDRLAFLGGQNLISLLDNALAYAESHQYNPIDLQLMQNLAEAIILIQPEGT